MANTSAISAPSDETQDLLSLTTEIVSAHVSNNDVAASDIPALIEQVHASLARIVASGTATTSPPRPAPAVPIKKSIMPDHLVCLEDGRKLKTLRRHLSTDHGLTPDEYRARWGLPSDYPMVASSYAAKRSELAKKIGLGSKGGRRKR